eukprot:jgi/Psemu1/308135/fgenesh1_kg.382_\
MPHGKHNRNYNRTAPHRTALVPGLQSSQQSIRLVDHVAVEAEMRERDPRDTDWMQARTTCAFQPVSVLCNNFACLFCFSLVSRTHNWGLFVCWYA